jgi:hypothetical protein
MAFTPLILLGFFAQAELPAPAVPPPAVPALAPRGATFESARDPITDTLSAFAVARAEGGGRLTIGCDADRYEGIRVAFTSRAWLPPERIDTRRRTVHYRFDSTPAGRVHVSTQGRTATLRPESHVLPFLRWIVASERLALRLRDIEGRRVTLLFDLGGSAAAVDRMLDACGRADLRPELFAAP